VRRSFPDTNRDPDALARVARLIAERSVAARPTIAGFTDATPAQPGRTLAIIGVRVRS
jgi:hypothetical protein